MNSKNKKSYCEECKKVFAQRQGFERPPCVSNKQFICAKECGKSFPRKDTLTRHIKTCKGYKKEHKSRRAFRFSCEIKHLQPELLAGGPPSSPHTPLQVGVWDHQRTRGSDTASSLQPTEAEVHVS